MSKFVRCKACGYIMDEAHVIDLCPACGLPKTVFEPYTKNISPKRRLLVELHLHPIAVHFPQVFISLIFFLPLLSMVVGDPWRSEFLMITKWSILTLPVVVLGGFVTGLIDGKIRFKKWDTPLLRRKMYAGAILQLLSIALLAVYLINGFTPGNLWLIIGLSGLCTGCAIYLGRLGATMFEAIMPG